MAGSRSIDNAYFMWMCQHVRSSSYGYLMGQLHNTDFQYTLPMDGNRESDGIDLRYRYGHDVGLDNATVARYLDDRPCSMLEMMVALAIRCEEHFMWDPDFGDRTGYWFWTMIESLGLSSMTDDRYDEDYVDRVLERFFNREYGRDGRGGLFTVRNPIKDMRSLDIWYQMNEYLNGLE